MALSSFWLSTRSLVAIRFDVAQPSIIVVYLLSLFLIICSALFSGLTLGYFTLDTATLRRRAKAGDTQAMAIYPIRLHGNLLLTTLLLGNVTANTILSIYLGSLASGLVASIIATTLIFLFGEIGPQAIISRHAMAFGSRLAPLVRGLMFVCYPVTFPIAFTLNKVLGQEMPTIYSRHELMQIVSEHEDSEFSTIDADEERIIHGALQFSHRQTREVMTPLEAVVMFDENQKLTPEFFEQVNKHGYSRFPVFSGNQKNITGLLYTKDLLNEVKNIAIKDAVEAYEATVLRIKPGTYLDTALAQMLKKHRHLGIVENKPGDALGVISLEDIIEEIIQVEIEDEDDEE